MNKKKRSHQIESINLKIIGTCVNTSLFLRNIQKYLNFTHNNLIS